MPENLRIGPVQILYDYQGWPVAAGAPRHRRPHRSPAAGAGSVGHRIVQRRPFPGLRQIEKVVKEDLLLLGDGSLSDQPFDCCAPFPGGGRRRKAEKALQQVANRVMPSADAEIEHQTSMGMESPRFGERSHLFDEPGLADAGVASDVDDVPGVSGAQRFENAFELLELSLPADKYASIRHRRGFTNYSAQSPHPDRRLDALKLKLFNLVTDATAGERSKHDFGKQCFARGGSSDEPRREIHGVSDHSVIMRLPSTHDAGDDLAVCNSDMGLQGTGQAAAPPRHCLVNIEGGPRRAQGIVFVGLWRAKKRHYGVAYVLIDRAAIAIDDAVDQRGEAIDQLMNLLSIQRAGKRCEPGEIREQDGDRTPLAVRLVRRFRRRRTRSTRASFDYRREQALAMAERVQS